MDLPEVVLQKDLSGLDVGGRPCEVCGNDMATHKWALLDGAGFAIFCSNLRFVTRGERRLFSEIYFDDGDTDGFSHVGYKDSTADAAKRSAISIQGEIDAKAPDYPVIGGKVFSHQEIIYYGNEVIHAEVGTKIGQDRYRNEHSDVESLGQDG